MQARFATRGALDEALRITNETFSGNVRWERIPEPFGRPDNQYRFTLRVHGSGGLGARVYRRHGRTRASIKACWHVHGVFFDALCSVAPGAEIRSANRTITATQGNWQDWPVTSDTAYSQECDCKAHGLGVAL